MEKVVTRVQTRINFTEDENKVKIAVANILQNGSEDTKKSYEGKILVSEAKGQESIEKFRNLLAMDRIRDAARKVLLKGVKGRTISFCLNKQAAFSGHISFCEEFAESPLGPLKFTIECSDSQFLIDWLTRRNS